MGEIITFYSYKGGTGRSMALANVGHILSSVNTPAKRVLMIDWDLEAPGLHKYFFQELRRNFQRDADAISSEKLNRVPGLVDFIHAISSFYQSTHRPGRLAIENAWTEEAQTAFKAAIAACPPEKFILAVAPGSSLFLMKAGDQSSSKYVDLVRSLNWQKFYDDYGSFFVLFQEYLTSSYDAVLIDSRTGLTDIGDICTRVMPEKLVAVFVPNEQNLEGIIEAVKGAAGHRLRSRDPRGLIVFPLASRIDSQRELLRKTWRTGGLFNTREVVGYEARFSKVFKEIYQLEECNLNPYFTATEVYYDADYAFGEEISARAGVSDRASISKSCANLVGYILDNRSPWEEPSLSDLSDARDRLTSESTLRRELESALSITRRKAFVYSGIATGAVVAAVAFGALDAFSWLYRTPRPRFLAAAEKRRRVRRTNTLEIVMYPPGTLLANPSRAPENRRTRCALHAVGSDGRVKLYSDGAGLKNAGIMELPLLEVVAHGSFGGLDLSPRNTTAIEAAALAAIEGARIPEACGMLLAGSRLTLRSARPNKRLFELLAGLAVRSDLENQYLDRLVDLLNANGSQSPFRSMIDRWRSAQSNWRRRWRDQQRRPVWHHPLESSMVNGIRRPRPVEIP